MVLYSVTYEVLLSENIFQFEYDNQPDIVVNTVIGAKPIMIIMRQSISVLLSVWSLSKSLINSLAPGGFSYSLKLVNFKLISMINMLSIFCEIATG